MKRLFILTCSLAMLGSCTAIMPVQDPAEAGEVLYIRINTHVSDTKTIISDDGSSSSFTFETGDKLGFFADGKLENIKFTCSNGAAGAFGATIMVPLEKQATEQSINYYAYSPFVNNAGSDPSALLGSLPTTQTAPFDGLADYMVANAETDKYDVKDFPDLTFRFDSHLFAIVKLCITNTSATYAEEQVLSIGLKNTAGGALAGAFTFDATDPTAEPVFTTDPNYLSDQVMVEYPEASRPTLGTNTPHAVYAVVRADDYAAGDLQLVVSTTNYIFRKSSSKALSLSRDYVTVLGSADVASMTRQKRVRTLVMWGDSITGSDQLKAFRAELGPNWNVIRSGVAGDTAQQVAGRQGGLPLYTGASAFTLPASAEDYVYIDGIYYYYNGAYGQVSHEWTYKSGYTPELNPLIINGIECEISYDTELKQRRLRRLADGEATEIPARTPVSTYGSRAYANVDAIVVYIGTNGRPSDAILIDIHDKMKAHLTEPEAMMFVLGFHQSTADNPSRWKEAYVSAFTEHYGDYFIDQRTLGGGLNAIPLMYEIGQITNEEQITETDRTYIDRGDWPLSWFRAPGDEHPNGQYGAKVQAILLRRRMAQLGLL